MFPLLCHWIYALLVVPSLNLIYGLTEPCKISFSSVEELIRIGAETVPPANVPLAPGAPFTPVPVAPFAPFAPVAPVEPFGPAGTKLIALVATSFAS